ncbi:MAG: hypothetical protein HYY37_04680 [Candidatus Aenigmarchaeota archaeon]|nr:hypothetical protein [Candidatus Aenigmarchaeota archaeon]
MASAKTEVFEISTTESFRFPELQIPNALLHKEDVQSSSAGKALLFFASAA